MIGAFSQYLSQLNWCWKLLNFNFVCSSFHEVMNGSFDSPTSSDKRVGSRFTKMFSEVNFYESLGEIAKEIVCVVRFQ